MKKRILLIFISTVLFFSMKSVADIDLPRNIAWTAYDSGSAGYSQAVAIGAALKNEEGINLRILPGKNDISRLLPLKMGRVLFSATTVGGAYLAQEGVFEFANEQWGPQPLRLVLENNSGEINVAVGVSVTSKIKTYEELRGKRVAYVEGAPALNTGTFAFLAYADLTWDDVNVIKYGGYGLAWRGFIAGEVDAMVSVTNTGLTYEAAAGPHGLFWPPIDPDNKEGINRLTTAVPYLYPNVATLGANIDKNIGHQGVSNAYPILVSYSEVDDNSIYNMVKAMDELFPYYDGKVQGIGGWSLDKQDFTQNEIPYHEGAIKYFKEKGIWDENAQKHNDMLISRQNNLIQAWENLEKSGSKDYQKEWYDMRVLTLEKGDFQVTFSNIE